MGPISRHPSRPVTRDPSPSAVTRHPSPSHDRPVPSRHPACQSFVCSHPWPVTVCRHPSPVTVPWPSRPVPSPCVPILCMQSYAVICSVGCRQRRPCLYHAAGIFHWEISSADASEISRHNTAVVIRCSGRWLFTRYACYFLSLRGTPYWIVRHTPTPLCYPQGKWLSIPKIWSRSCKPFGRPFEIHTQTHTRTSLLL